MVKFYKELFLFLKNPGAEAKSDLSKGNIVLLSVVSHFILLVCFSFLLKFLDEQIGIPAHKSGSSFKGVPLYKILLSGVLIVPVVEEIAFRLYIKFSRINISVSFGALAYFLISFSTKTKLYQLSMQTLYKVLICAALGVIIFWLLGQDRGKRVQNIWSNKARIVLYFSILLFAAVHVRNLILVNPSDYFLVPILLLPQALMGIFLSFTRINAGIWYAILTHGIINLPSVIGFMGVNA